MYFYFSHLTCTFHLNCCLNKIFVIVIVIVIVIDDYLSLIFFVARLKRNRADAAYIENESVDEGNHYLHK